MTGPTRTLTPSLALSKLRTAFEKELSLSTTSAATLLAKARLYDKAYELSCLIEMMAHLKNHMAGTTFTLANGSVLEFRAKGGPIDRQKWSYIEMNLHGDVAAELWVDIECLSLSGVADNKTIGSYSYGLAHELDLVLVYPGVSGRVHPDELWIGVEAKHCDFSKALLKELLGVRRETAYRNSMRDNPFAWWANSGQLPANPPSGLVAFCLYNTILKYDDPAEHWGLHMICHPY